MTFKHKLASRLALLKDRRVAFPVAALAAAVVFACEQPLPTGGTGGGSITNLVISPKTLMLRENATTEFTAVGFTSTGDSASVAVTWSVTSGSIIDTSSTGKRHYGHYKAPTSPGQYKVVANANPSSLSDTATVTVTLAPVSSVTVSPSSASVLVGGTIQLTATLLDSMGNALTGRTVTWASGSTGVATVNSSGVVTGVTGGAATITATSEGQSGTATITVSTVPVASVTVSPASVSIQTGQTAQLTATAKDANGNTLPGRAMTWSTSNGSVATVSGSGLVSGVGAGSATITATSEGQSGTASVTVTFVPVASVTVSPATASLQVGQTVQLTATPKDANGNPLSGKVVTWSSSSGSVATVNGSGLVSAVGSGSATVTATSEGQSGTSTITVTAAPVATVTVSPSAAAVQPGQTVQLTATLKDANGNILTGRTVTWQSNNTAAATVNASGLVSGVATGTALITATSEGKSGTAVVAVGTPPPPATCAPTGAGQCYWVDGATGNDGNPGDSTRPFKTVQHAADVVNPGDVVIVRNGVYTGDANAVVSIGRGGTASDWVVFKSEHKWGAALDGNNNATDAGVVFSANYVRVQDFEIRNEWHNGVTIGSDYAQFVGNNIHDIGRICTSSAQGLSAIDIYGNGVNVVVDGNLVHDFGRFGPGENGCVPGNDYWQNHDHGMYIHAGNNLVIQNNIFFDIFHGYQIQFYSGSVSNLFILNNMFAFGNPNRAEDIIVALPITTALIANNIFYQPTSYGILWGGSESGVTASNNLSTSALSSGAGSGVTLTANLENTDPLLVNPTALDFHLQAGSPAIGSALCSAEPPTDFAGNSRAGACVMGAFTFP